MSRHALIVTAALAVLSATAAAAFAEDGAPAPYVYYVVPCDSPGAIPAAPADSAATPTAPVCVVPVATDYAMARGLRRYRYDPYYADPWPYWSVGVTHFGAHHHHGGHGGGLFSHGGHGGHFGGHGGHHGGGLGGGHHGGH